MEREAQRVVGRGEATKSAEVICDGEVAGVKERLGPCALTSIMVGVSEWFVYSRLINAFLDTKRYKAKRYH